MATHITLDDALVSEALKIGGKTTTEETVAEALREYINRRKQASVLELFGTVDYGPKHDYKRQRRR